MDSGYIGLMMTHNMGRNQLTYENNRLVHDVTPLKIFDIKLLINALC